MKKLSIALIALGLAASCSSSKTDTQPDEIVKETTETVVEAEPIDHAKIVAEAHAAYSSGDLETTMANFTDDSTWENVGAPAIEGQAGIQQYMEGLKGMMSDLAVAPRRVFVASDAKITITQGVLKGTQDGAMADGSPASGKPVTNDFVHIQWFDDEGKITRTFALSNGTTVPKQIGAMPVPKGANPPMASAWPGAPEIIEWSDNQGNIDVLNAWVAAAAANDKAAHAAGHGEGFSGAAFGDHIPALTTEASTKWLAQMHKTFSGVTVENVHGWSFGDHVVGVYKVSMKHTGPIGNIKATQKDVSMHFVDVAKIVDGKVAWLESYSNPVELMGQLMPAPKATAMK